MTRQRHDDDEPFHLWDEWKRPQEEHGHVSSYPERFTHHDVGPLRELEWKESLDAIVTFAGGFDTRIEGGHPYPCDPQVEDPDTSCNAVGMCILMQMDGIVIDGVAQP